MPPTMSNLAQFRHCLLANSGGRQHRKLNWKQFMKDFMFHELENEVVQHNITSHAEFEWLMVLYELQVRIDDRVIVYGLLSGEALLTDTLRIHVDGNTVNLSMPCNIETGDAYDVAEDEEDFVVKCWTDDVDKDRYLYSSIPYKCPTL